MPASEPDRTSDIHEALWGVRRSFLEYVRRAGGSVLLAGGVSGDELDLFRFPVAPGPDGTLVLDGALHFEAHQGALAVRLRALRLEPAGSALLLTTMHAAYRRETDERAVLAEIPLVSVRLDEFGAATADDVLLTVDGSAAFGHNYPPGAPLDPIVLTAGAAASLGLTG